MPHIPQILTQANIFLKAQLSIKKNVPCALWGPVKEADKPLLRETNWLSPYAVPTLTFLVGHGRRHILGSFFFVDSRWQLTFPIDAHIKTLLNTSPALNLYASGDSLKDPTLLPGKKIFWSFIKQNDFDIQRLICSSLILDQPFLLPYSDISLKPLGITYPISSFPSNSFNIDPTSRINFKSGHNFTQKLCHSDELLIHRQITYPEWQGRLKKPVDSWSNINLFSCSIKPF